MSGILALVAISRQGSKSASPLNGWSPRLILSLVVAFTMGVPALALDPSRAITQYARDTWTAKDGAPAGTITSLTQTPDGYLWLGTTGEGLVRFDGVRFSRVRDLDAFFGHSVDRITSLVRGRDGTLWVGTGHGLARLRNGRWSAFDRGDARDVYGLHEAADGSISYARHWEGLYRVQGDAVTLMPLATKPRFTTSDAHGALWVGGYEGLWRIDGSRLRFYSMDDGLPDQNVSQLHGDGNGNVWVAFQLGFSLLRDATLVRTYTTEDGLPSNDVSLAYTDDDGNVWVGTVDGGLARLRGDGFDSLNRAQGLTNDHVTALYEDREGSLWIGTASGLNRLRDVSVLPIGEAEGLSRRQPLSIAAGPDGTVFVASGFGGLGVIRGADISVESPQSVPGSTFDGPLYADPEGGIWSAHRDGLSYRRGSRRKHYELGVGQVSCVAGGPHGIVFATGTGEVFRLVGERAVRYALADGSLLGPESFGFDYVWMLYQSRAGDLWLATTRGALAVKDGQARWMWRQGALSARSIHEDTDGVVWLGTMAGLVRVAGDSVAAFTPDHGLPDHDIYHALSDARGDIWFACSRGIFRARVSDLESVARGVQGALAARPFGPADGMRTSEATNTHQPSAAVTPDGRLWFATTAGVAVVDPERVLLNPLEPPVVVEAVTADGEIMALGADVRIAADTQRVDVHYNGLSLLVPQRVRFKYRLEGYDDEWIDAAGERVARYTRLPPGHYTFRVIAANNDGVWNEAGASVALVRLPHFYETGWFAALCALALVAALYAAHRLRVARHVRAEHLLEERVQQALAEIKTLSGLLPLCAWCRRVREDGGYWRQLEAYVSAHSHAEFTHGICPDCRERQRPRGAAPPVSP